MARWALPAIAFVSIAASAQRPAADLPDEQIRGVVSGKTLVLRFSGTPVANPLFFTYWDFRADGSLCGRLIGAAARTECAEVGKWWAQDNTLCWRFQGIGTSTGINSACGAVRKGDGDLYDITHTAGKLGTTVFSLAR